MQTPLFGREALGFDAALGSVQRLTLSADAWLEHAPSWLSGHQTLFQQLLTSADWRHQRRQMYEREVDVPRLVAHAPKASPAGATLSELSALLSKRYARKLDSLSLAYYRDGRDSVAPHGDKMGPLRANTVIAIVSLGEPRRFTLKAVDASMSLSFRLGWGDLLVMGGSCQEGFVHAIPKVKYAGPRISIQFRETLPEGVAKAQWRDTTVSRQVRVNP